MQGLLVQAAFDELNRGLDGEESHRHVPPAGFFGPLRFECLVRTLRLRGFIRILGLNNNLEARSKYKYGLRALPSLDLTFTLRNSQVLVG